MMQQRFPSFLQLMKKHVLLGAIMVVSGLAIASTFAQTQSTTTQTTTTGYIQSSAVVGSKIKDSRGEEVGEIKGFCARPKYGLPCLRCCLGE
jgi:hypothetical protein